MVDALVEHDYIAKSPSELTIKKGDIIREVTRKHEGWCEGVLREKRGLFPDSSVRMLDREPAVVYRSRKDGSRMRRCKVVFSYKQDHEDELNLNVGDVIEVLGEEEEGWWRGLLNGREGVFPSNFVVEIPGGGSRESLKDLEDDKSPVLPPKPAKLQCQVKFDYKAENSDELTIKEGDIITVLTQEGTDPGWWFGELNGRMGVFPDNFVVLLPHTAQEEKKTTKEQQSGARPTSVAQQRKSLEVKTEKIENESSALKTTPPLPSKKPLLPVKKSPSGSSSTGLFSGIKKKFTDAVDGGSVSKSSKIESKVDTSTSEASADNAFDQVERRPLLSDVRATRAKAPGRRPPSVVYKEGEPGVMNGNMEHPQPTNLDTLSEKLGNSNSSIDQDTTTPEQKPKLREWEKHKAPWLAEMKLNQAKRTSTSPGPEQNKPKLQNSDGVNLKLTLTNDKTDTPDEVKKEQSPVDTQKHTNFGGRLKTPPADSEKHTSSVVLRQKPAAPAAPVRPQTIQNVNDVQHAKQQPQTPTKLPLPGLAKTPSPVTKPVATEKINECGGGDAAVNQEQPVVSYKQYAELLERIQKLESLVEKQFSAHTTAIENLKGRLQVETDLRIMLQAKLDEVVQCVMQV